MDYLQQCIDLRRQDIEPESFALALAVRYIRVLTLSRHCIWSTWSLSSIAPSR